MKLWVRSQHTRILEIAEHGLHMEQPAVGADDLGGAPLAAISDQQPQTKILRGQAAILFPITPQAHSDGFLLCRVHFVSHHRTHILTTTDSRQSLLRRWHAGLPAHLLQLSPAAIEALMKTTQLSLVQLRTKHNHGFAFFAGNELSRAPSLHHCSRGKLHLFEMIDSCGQQYLVVGRTHSGYVAVLFRVESIQVL